ncbi:protein of unknown function, B. Theta Gene description [Bacteroides faecichinchillae]|uniref:Uncharacterized protein n=1 Tax=Bacteroides faecichinchillae TaxID=871325 RepID=A0A1M4ZH21_9BACE|nr:DUF4119 family protein [Bacteroides faecichinchillae]THG68260.1 hypothetical protein E5981_05110 [Bacteroides faecichinchillae]SHF17275.1 protein of unknown function, B. Theta Gene description [Bacteroides faecichinchillae]
MVSKKSSPKGTKKQTKMIEKMAKKRVQKQYKNEIISREELENRGGLVGSKIEYLNLHLKKFLEKHLYYHHLKTLSDLALYIYHEKKLYYSKHNGFKLMEYSSILTELSTLSKSEQKLLKEQKEESKMNTKKYPKRKR